MNASEGLIVKFCKIVSVSPSVIVNASLSVSSIYGN